MVEIHAVPLKAGQKIHQLIPGIRHLQSQVFKNIRAVNHRVEIQSLRHGIDALVVGVGYQRPRHKTVGHLPVILKLSQVIERAAAGQIKGHVGA